MLQEPQEDSEAVYENALRYQPWIEIETPDQVDPAVDQIADKAKDL
jgi:hypothetical protein